MRNVIEGWLAPTIALAIDRGLLDQWPFELTRSGRRFRSWEMLLARGTVHRAPMPDAPAEEGSPR
jgi:hypothetical protein